MKKTLLITVALFSFLLNLLCLNAQWEEISIPITYPLLNIEALAISEGNILAGTNAGLYLSANNGDNWALVCENTAVEALAIRGGTTFAGTMDGLYFSTNNGNNWIKADNNGLLYSWITSLAITSENIYSGTMYTGVYISTDNGNNWNHVRNGLNVKFVSALAICQDNVFAGTPVGLFLSTNNGNSWVEKNTGLKNTKVQSIAISDNNIFVGTMGGGVFLSTDMGNNWTDKNSGLTNGNVFSISISGNYIFAGTSDGGIFQSTDMGNSWADKNSGLINGYVFSIAINDNYIFAGTDNNGIYRAKISDLITSIDDEKHTEFVLSISPNPFSHSTSINYELQTPGRVRINIFNSLGEKITTLVDEWQEAGRHNCELQITNYKLSAGMYYYRIQIGDRIESGKLLLIK